MRFGNRFCGVEHTLINDKECVYITLLKKSKNTIDVKNQYESATIQDISNQIPKKQHIHLTVNNSEVLTKSIEDNNGDAKLILHKAFPNIDINDFFYEIISQDSFHVVSICRKSYINEILNTYKKLKLQVINISLGNSIISSIKKVIEVNLISTSNAIIKLDKGNLISLKDNEDIIEEYYNINGLKVNNYYLLSLVSGLEVIIKQSVSKSNLKTLTKKLLSDFNQIRFFDQFLRSGLVFLIVLLLINFLVFNAYYSNVEMLKQTSLLHAETKNKIKELTALVDEKQSLVNDVFNRSTSKSSFYVNEVIQSLPNSILLSEFNSYPLEKAIKKDELIKVNDKIIYISGISSDNSLFSIWITELEALLWVDIITIAYRDVSSTKSSFSIKINMTDAL